MHSLHEPQQHMLIHNCRRLSSIIYRHLQTIEPLIDRGHSGRASNGIFPPRPTMYIANVIIIYASIRRREMRFICIQ